MKKSLMIVSAAIVLFSCKKEDSGCSKNVANISGTYKIVSVKEQVSATAPETDITNEWFSEPCEKDNLYILKSDGTFEYNDAGIVCDPSDSYTGTWSLNGNMLDIDGDNADITSFDCHSLIITSTDVMTPGDKIKITFEKQ
jgi:hypothetical protein